MKKTNFSVSTLTIMLAMASCSLEPKVNEFSDTANPQVEIDKVDQNLRQAESQQVQILSPENFEEAKKARTAAVDARAKNKEQKVVLHKIALAQGYLTKALGVAGVANQVLQAPIEARQQALDVESPRYFAEEFTSLDKQMLKITSQIEKGDTSVTEKNRDALAAKYRDLELKTIKKSSLGQAEVTIQEAIKEGAKKLTPETLARTEKAYSDAEATIENNHRNSSLIRGVSVEVTAAADRLLKIVRLAKNSTAMSPEDFAKQAENNEKALIQSETKLNRSAAELDKSEDNLAKISDQNDKLESQLSLDKKFETARKQFSKNEADFSKQGNKFLLRLKGLTFANNDSVLAPANFKLMEKVQRVIGEVSPKHILVEGHTDSKGGSKLNSKLSIERAQAVRSYLLANNHVGMETIDAAGKGDSNPIASNKTSSGRAQNRRVDIIITSE